jgi:restriction system protein
MEEESRGGFGIPHNIGPFFVGREAELSALSNAFDMGVKTVVVQGTAGSGKTALVWMFVERRRDLFPGGTFFTHGFAAEPMGHAIKRVVSEPPAKSALLVIDDAELLDQKDTSEIQSILRSMPQLSVILTTRKSLNLDERQQFTISLSSLSQEEVGELLKHHLINVDGEEIQKFYGLVQGNALLTGLAADLLKDQAVTWNELFSKLSEFERPGIVGPDGQPLRENSVEQNRIITDVARTNDEILALLRSNPEIMRSLPSRQFEEIIAEILTRQGYQITLTPPTRDGGFDMYAAKHDTLGSFLYLVECKRYTPPNHVGVEVVRGLYGVLQSRKATAGVIITSSFFTSGAVDFQRENFHQLHLRDYISIQDWLKSTH